jgi:hypothetical protein
MDTNSQLLERSNFGTYLRVGEEWKKGLMFKHSFWGARRWSQSKVAGELT